MTPTGQGSVQQILDALRERAKELNCLYQIDDIVHRADASLQDIFRGVIETIPSGWQYPGVCRARIRYRDHAVEPPGFEPTRFVLSAPLVVDGQPGGAIEVYYTQPMPPAAEGPFLREERKLLDAIADRLSFVISQRRLRSALDRYQAATRGHAPGGKREWWVVLDFLRRTDRNLLQRIGRKMVNHLTWRGIPEARELLRRFAPSGEGEDALGDNRPRRRAAPRDYYPVVQEAFRIAADALSDDETVGLIHKWIKDDKSSFLLETLESEGNSVMQIADAIARYAHVGIDERELSASVQMALRVALVRRLLTGRIDFVNVAKTYLEVRDFSLLAHHTIASSQSHGKLGGKSAGLLLGEHISRRSQEYGDVVRDIRIPRTWYLTSDAILDFVRYNNLEDLYDRKYLDIEQVRSEYPNVVQLFKNSHFPPEIARGMGAALDDLEERPLIVRSSSLLEDQSGAAFSGKYKSLFLANTGSRKERLAALGDAVAEVYASVFGPDPIGYRAERGMLDQHEEMGIMLQECVGSRVGKYFFPAFAGVALSNNELRWSPRIRREDGLVRLVPGLGTRAVDRLIDDYPVLVSPGQPGLRVNATPDEIIRYSPRRIDVINLETRRFDTLEVRDLLREVGGAYPALRQVVSVIGEDGVPRSLSYDTDLASADVVVTFEELVARTPFMTRMQTLLQMLREKTQGPVDIEFASDGKELYLLQCRTQSYSEEAAPAPIPRDLPEGQVLFSANRYVSNGRVPDLTHIVYVDPDEYAALGELGDLQAVGRAVGRLNQLLPKRQFILMGPGRWGSRGDIRLGVSVTYSEVNNTAVLAEVARQRGNYVPDLSFGTHFFQDLVEASIRYLPLYPDDPGVRFNEAFFRRSPSVLGEMLPEYERLGRVLRVIDVPRVTDGRILRVLMNADLGEAVGVLAPPGGAAEGVAAPAPEVRKSAEDAWRWRMRMAERIAAHLDAPRFGVKGMWVFGSAKNATAGPGSDLDILVHFQGTDEQRSALLTWLEGWGRALAEINHLRTGYASDNLLDVHLVSDEDIASRTSYAAKIDAVTDAARPLPLGTAVVREELPRRPR